MEELLRRFKTFKKEVGRVIEDWLSTVYIKDEEVVTFLKTEEVSNLLSRKVLRRVVASKNRYLFSGDVMLVYSQEDFKPIHYTKEFIGYNYTNLVWFKEGVEDFRDGLIKAYVFSGSTLKDRVIKSLAVRGVEIYEAYYSSKEALRVVRNSALGCFHYRILSSYSPRVYVVNGRFIPEYIYYVLCMIDTRQGLDVAIPKVYYERFLNEDYLRFRRCEAFRRCLDHARNIYNLLTTSSLTPDMEGSIKMLMGGFLNVVEKLNAEVGVSTV